MNFEILKPFGPSIVKVVMPKEIVVGMNEYVDNLIKNKNEIDKLNHGKYLAGNVTNEFRLDVEFMKKIKWVEFLATSCEKWLLEGHNITLRRFDMIASWIVRQFKNEYNPTHWHSGHVSGVGYLKVPNTLGESYQKNKNQNSNGKLELIHGSKMFLCNSTIKLTPKVGDFYFFPNYLMHNVYPFSDTDEERRSISFNATIDDNIYNVYEY